MPDIRRASPILIRMSAVVFIAAAAGGCSSLPDWLGGDSSAAAQPAPATDGSAAANNTTGSQGKTVAEASDQYPVLADTPSKAPPTTSSDEQKQVANALVADRSQAQYSAEALQAGKEPAAAPPPPASAEANLPIPPPLGQASGATAAPTAPPSAPAATQMASAEPAGRAPMPGTLPVDAASTPPAGQAASSNPAISTEPMPPPAPVPAPSVNAPQLPAPPPAAPAPTVTSDDAALGFQPSRAPPLDPAVAQLMGNPEPTRRQRLASISAPPAAVPVRSRMASNGAPAAIVDFPANTIALDASGIAQVQSAVAAWRAKGDQGYVRVVGHSSSGSPNLPVDRRMTQSLERSQACATAVARELIKQGVPANRVLVDASASVSDSEQRRAEIFLQS